MAQKIDCGLRVWGVYLNLFYFYLKNEEKLALKGS